MGPDAKNLIPKFSPDSQDGRTVSFAVPGAVASIVLPPETLSPGAPLGVLNDREQCRLAIGDVTLYERKSWIARLGAEQADSDLSLVLKAFDHGGHQALAGMVGDFSFVVWDWKRKTVLAARDHFGVRPLLYRSVGGYLVLGNNLRDLLGLQPRNLEVDAEVALDFLLADYRHSGRSIFRNFRKVLPGHVLLGREGEISEQRYWQPPVGVLPPRSYGDHLEEWRHHFRTAVHDRLGTEGTIVAHLSGGLDSASIVCAAHERYATDPGTRTPFATVSAVYPGLACDETRYIDAVVERIPMFESIYFDGTRQDEGPLQSPSVTFPALGNGPGGGHWGDMDAVRARKAGILLAGIGGDEVGRSWHIFRDLWSHGCLGVIMTEVLSAASWDFSRRCLSEGIRAFIPQDVLDMLMPAGRAAEIAEPWLADDLVRVFSQRGRREEVRQEKEFGPKSHLQRGIWAAMNSPQLFHSVDSTVLVGQEAGVEVRMPYLDVRLVNFVMTIPWRSRIPFGDMRRTQRDALSPFLPGSVLKHRKISLDEVIPQRVRKHAGQIREIFFDRRWASGTFVKQREAQKMLETLTKEDPEYRRRKGWRQIWRMANFEVWLHLLMRYRATGDIQ